MKKEGFWAISTLVGCTIGAGVLGLPYIIAKAGFLTGMLLLIILAIVVCYLNLALGEVMLRTKGNHQLVNLAERYLGGKAKILMLIVMVSSIYGALSAYTIGSGQAIAAMFGGPTIIYSLVFLLILSTVIFFGINVFERSEFYLTAVMVAVILLLIGFGSSSIDASNLSEFSLSKIYIPFGIMLFAFGGFSAIPSMKEELKDKKTMKKAIIYSAVLITLIYIGFSALSVGVNGLNTSEIATIALGETLGKSFAIIGNLFSLFALATSFTALGYALKEVFYLDLKLKKLLSWVLVISVPLIVLLFKLAGFVKILNYTGGIASTIVMIMVILIFRNAKTAGQRKPEYEVFYNPIVAGLIIAAFAAGGIMVTIS